MEPARHDRFEQVFRENYAAVRAYALRRAPRDVAQDVVAETFLVAWRRLEEVPGDPLPWLFGVARRMLANQLRSTRRQAALEGRLAGLAPTDGARDPSQTVGDAELVRTALASLTDRDREALLLVGWDGLSGARAARAAGCSRAAFAVRLHRARAKLAAALSSLERASGALETGPLEVG